MNYLERIVSLYLDYAELQAERKIPMSMEDWAKRLDGFLEFNGNELLTGPGKSVQSRPNSMRKRNTKSTVLFRIACMRATLTVFLCWNRRCARKMKFNFKIQQYQTDAVDAVVKVFQGQGYHDKISYIRDLGKKQENQQMRLNVDMDQQYSLDMGQSHQLNIYDMDDDTGYKNEVIELPDEQLLINIQKLQSQNNIKQSKELVKDLGRCSLDIEMETGTGKTYVYIKTMFELNKKYGWSKFIVVVPSIAIREGVKRLLKLLRIILWSITERKPVSSSTTALT